MLVAAVGDVHGTMYLNDFKRSLSSMPEVDLFLLAGDIARRNTLSEFDKVVGLIDSPMIGVFGNEEWETEKYSSAHPEITFLSEEAVVFKGTRIVGSTGALDMPTQWQAQNVPGISSVFSSRISKLNSLLNKNAVLLTHYAPTYLTLVGEGPDLFPRLGSEALEKVILEKKPRLVLHAHAHMGSPSAMLDGVPIRNVSFPVNRGITVVQI